MEAVEGGVKWVGGNTTVVQLGDVLDRGDSEIGEGGVEVAVAVGCVYVHVRVEG